MLFSYPTEGGDVAQATSINGSPYSGLPNAFKYRQQFDATCSCKKPGQSWADAMGKDEAVEPGDVVVTEDRAKQLSQPPAQKGQPKGRAPAAAGAPPAQTAAPPAAVAPPAAAETDASKRTIRSVGPTFIPPRITQKSNASLFARSYALTVSSGFASGVPGSRNLFTIG